ncbi:unnamed protein product [Paramecium pentaurelia]|uniref:Uncharacterized protein n=1 Tax=Paramecium pentaurelia TaxID=43138 RepID=A0A8S1T4B3_9CILI|nr:unnamed protein product [Paramecium pentaurelia]
MIESPCQTLQRLNNLFTYLENNTYQCNHIALSKLNFQRFKKFPIPQPFIDHEVEYLSAVKQQPKQNQQNKPDLILPDTTKNVESLKEFTLYVQNIKQQRKQRKFGKVDQNKSAINFRVKKENGQQRSPTLFRQNSIHQNVYLGKKKNIKVEVPSPRPNKTHYWAKELFQKLENDQVRGIIAKQSKNEQQVWNMYHKKNYEKKLFDLELRPQTEIAIKQFQKSILEKIQ